MNEIKTDKALHDWVKSTLGHGDAMCSRCLITNREAAVLGRLNACDVPPKPTHWIPLPPPPKGETE